ncbi:MAG TPA: ABC transporter permease [Acidimicrobiales bacterium]|nr:ABC transporter permease [Acidimicrobiales bacterium]
MTRDPRAPTTRAQGAPREPTETRVATGSFRGLADLRLVGRQVYYEQLNFWLNPIGAVFTVGFSVVFLLLVGSSSGHSHSKALAGGEVIAYYVPGFIAYGVMAACFNMLAITLVVRRETGLLKRLRLSPLPTWALLSAVVVNSTIVSAVQVVLVLVIGRFGYHVAFPHDPAAFVVTLLVGVASFTAVGIATSTLIPNQESGGPVTSIVFFVLLFLSGLWYPIAPGSGLAKFSSYFPVRHMILAVYASFGSNHGASAWAWHDMGVLAIWGAAGVVVAARRWSWAPRQARRGRQSITALGSMYRRWG